MPLYVNNNLITEVPSTVTEFLREFPQFKISAKQLEQEDVKKVGPVGLLYVQQGECATVLPQDGSVQLIGSEDATTCHIVILRHEGSGAVCLAHCDGSDTVSEVKSMIGSLENVCPISKNDRIQLHIIGGFLDERGFSEKLSRGLLSAFCKEDAKVHLETACIGDLNDIVRSDGFHYPVCYGIVYDVKKKALHKATFPDHSPDTALRSAVQFCGIWMTNIYDTKTELMTIGPHNYKPCADAAEWAEVPDHFFRKYLSTSPRQEPPTFEAHMRETLVFLRDNPQPMRTIFKNSKPRLYKKVPDGRWLLQ